AMTPGFTAARIGRWPGSTPNSPEMLGAVNSSTASVSFLPSGVTTSSWIVSAMSALHLLAGGLDLFDVALEVEGLLRQAVELTVEDLLEAGDGVLEGHELAGEAGELRGDEERLRQEALDASGTPDHQLVVLAELVHAEDRDDVLQIL